MNTKVTVFGASGFIGKTVVEYLSKKGVRVTATDIRPMDIKLPENAEFISADILDEQHLDQLVDGADIIVHLAVSNLRTSLRNPKRNVKININGTLNILEAARKHGVKKIVYSSASSVYGIPRYLPVDEEHPKKPTTVYGVTKYTSEHLVRVYQELYGVDYCILRFTNVYGPYQHPDTGGLIPVVMSKILKGEEVTVFGDGSQTRDFVYVGDVAELINRAVTEERLRNEIANAGMGINTSILEVVRTCGKVLGIEPKTIFKPQEGGERKGFQADITKCNQIFQKIPDTPLEVGLKNTAEWIKLVVK